MRLSFPLGLLFPLAAQARQTVPATPAMLIVLGVATALLLAPPAHADDGHDHGHGDAAPIATGPALPRFAAVSDAFELVGVLDGRRITLWLDRAADNAPVTDARIELEIAGEKLEADKHDDVYEVMLAARPEAGVLPIIAMITVGGEVDLLSGELDYHDEAHVGAGTTATPWTRHAGWAAGGVAAVVVLLVAGRRAAASRQSRAGDAA